MPVWGIILIAAGAAVIAALLAGIRAGVVDEAHSCADTRDHEHREPDRFTQRCGEDGVYDDVQVIVR